MRIVRVSVATLVAVAASASLAPAATAEECLPWLLSCDHFEGGCMIDLEVECVGQDGEYCAGEPDDSMYCQYCVPYELRPAFCTCESTACHIVWGVCGEADRRLGLWNEAPVSRSCYDAYTTAYDAAHGPQPT